MAAFEIQKQPAPSSVQGHQNSDALIIPMAGGNSSALLEFRCVFPKFPSYAGIFKNVWNGTTNTSPDGGPIEAMKFIGVRNASSGLRRSGTTWR